MPTSIPVIDDFLNERKQKWLEPRLKKVPDNDSLKQELNDEADIKFSYQDWIPKAASRAIQLNLTTHVPKFSHPKAKASNIDLSKKAGDDAYLRSGNFKIDYDVYGNAAALDVFQFLRLEVDGKTLLQCIEEKESSLLEAFKHHQLDFDTLAEQFLMIKDGGEELKTDALIKQVYFPLSTSGTDYHILSTLTQPTLLFSLKEKINGIRFGKGEEEKDNLKQLRKAKKANQFVDGIDNSFKEIYNLTEIAFGGTKPQNISNANSKNGGVIVCLSSLPPTIEKRALRLPKRNFFSECLYGRQFFFLFERLHKQLLNPRNRIDERQAIKETVITIVEKIIEQAWQYRALEKAWSEQETYSKLKKSHKMWLDNKLFDPTDHESWSPEIILHISKWIINSYKNRYKGKDTAGLDDSVQTEIQKWVEETMIEFDEVIR